MTWARTTTLGCLLLLLAAGCGRPASRHVCAKRCAVASDCCPPGVAGCPGEYPQNYDCVDGLCSAPHCTLDAHCGSLAGTQGLPLSCVAIGGRFGCTERCASQDDCHGPTTCDGRADDGGAICRWSATCSADRPCLGNLHCMGGSCRCLLDSDCGSNPKVHCVDGACGCATDSDCQPNLDVCTDDPRFAYPGGAAAGSPRR